MYSSDGTVDERNLPLYVTRYGYLTFEIEDADDFEIDGKEQVGGTPTQDVPWGWVEITNKEDKDGYFPRKSTESSGRRFQ